MAVADIAFQGIARLVGLVGGQENTRRVTVRPDLLAESLLVTRPARELYDHWRDPENLATILPFVERVQPVDEREARWSVRVPGRGTPAEEWAVRVAEDVPGERLTWHGRTHAGVEHEVRVCFNPGPRGTGVRFELRRLGGGTDELLREPVLTRIRDGLRDFKRRMETGEVPTNTGQPRGTCATTTSKRP